MTPFVVDASLTGSWFLPDEKNESADSAFSLIRAGKPAFAPSIWAYEVRQIILKAERRQRLAVAEAASYMNLLDDLAVVLVVPPSYGALYETAWRFNLSVYDAAYLDLAARESLPLASLDRALCDAARRVGIVLFHPLVPGP